MAERRPVDVAVIYSGALAQRLVSSPGLVDVVSLIPELLWHESSKQPRYQPIRPAAELFETARAGRPIVLHGIGLSIGSDLTLDVEHLDQIASVCEEYEARWYSEHLAAFQIQTDDRGPVHGGVGLPVPFDTDSLRALIPKVAQASGRVRVPFLLENSAIYVEVPDEDMTEAAFLNRLCDETGSMVLLDLHNLVVNEINLGWNGEQYLEELDLTNVLEIHVAGGEMLGAWYTDAHSGACPDRVWELLAEVVPAAPALRLVTFEMHESRVPILGHDGLTEQLDRIRGIADPERMRVA